MDRQRRETWDQGMADGSPKRLRDKVEVLAHINIWRISSGGRVSMYAGGEAILSDILATESMMVVEVLHATRGALNAPDAPERDFLHLDFFPPSHLFSRLY